MDGLVMVDMQEQEATAEVQRFIFAKRHWQAAHAAYQRGEVRAEILADAAEVMALVLMDNGVTPDARQFFGW